MRDTRPTSGSGGLRPEGATDDPAVLAARQRTMELTCLAGLAGLPALTVPLRTAAGLPCAVSLIAAPGRDRDLLALAVALDADLD